MVSINLSRVVLSALLILALFPFALRAEEEIHRAVFHHLGDKDGHSFSEKESKALKSLFEKYALKSDSDEMKEESKHHELLKMGNTIYFFHHGDIYNASTKQWIAVPERFSKKFISFYTDNKVSAADQSALFAFVLKEWISEETAKK